MLQYERFEKIIDMLRQQPSVRVTDLVPILDASESTIRRDIAELDKERAAQGYRCKGEDPRG